MLKELALPSAASVEPSARLAALLAQLDRIPDRPDAADPLPWDEHGLPA
jgi:antitoxin VapB